MDKGVHREEESEGSPQQNRGSDEQKPDTRPKLFGQPSDRLGKPYSQTEITR